MKPHSGCTFSCLLALCVLFPVMVGGHCDAMDGPVVMDAKAALTAKDATVLLKWVKPEHEAQVRALFAKTLIVRTNGVEARELADQYLFETVVRLHREGEGAAYTGLKPTGTDPGVTVRLADQALEKNDVKALTKLIHDESAAGLQRRFAAVMEKKKHAARGVEAGREYVAAYVEFVHYAEGVYDSAARERGHLHEGKEHPQAAVKHAD